VSVHASHAWSWYEPAQGATRTVRWPARLTTANSPSRTAKGLWWDGLDPQDLYAQNHAPGNQKDWEWWEWNAAKGCSIPDPAYVQKFFLRTQQLWDDYRPDMIYFDDTVLPLHGMTDEIGLKLAAHFTIPASNGMAGTKPW